MLLFFGLQTRFKEFNFKEHLVGIEIRCAVVYELLVYCFFFTGFAFYRIFVLNGEAV